MHTADGSGGARGELRVPGLPARHVRGDFERNGDFLEFRLRPDHAAPPDHVRSPLPTDRKLAGDKRFRDCSGRVDDRQGEKNAESGAISQNCMRTSSSFVIGLTSSGPTSRKGPQKARTRDSSGNLAFFCLRLSVGFRAGSPSAPHRDVLQRPGGWRRASRGPAGPPSSVPAEAWGERTARA